MGSLALAEKIFKWQHAPCSGQEYIVAACSTTQHTAYAFIPAFLLNDDRPGLRRSTRTRSQRRMRSRQLSRWNEWPPRHDVTPRVPCGPPRSACLKGGHAWECWAPSVLGPISAGPHQCPRCALPSWVGEDILRGPCARWRARTGSCLVYAEQDPAWCMPHTVDERP